MVKRTHEKTGANEDMLKSIVLLSGGIDSTTTLAIAKKQFEPIAVTFDYGQRHIIEIESAKKIAEIMRVEHKIIKIDLRAIGGSALTDNIDVPKNRIETNIPVTYVPARNIIFLSYAVALAEVVGARDIFIGATAVDYSGYPDCRPEFISSFERMANLGTKAANFKIHAPVINMTKIQIIKAGIILGIDYSLTHSCYDPKSNGAACGECDSCLIRQKALKEALC